MRQQIYCILKMKKKVLITYSLAPEGIEDLLKRSDKYEVTLPEKGTSFRRGQVLAMIPDHHVLIPNFSFYTDKEIMDTGSRLELISNYAVGFNNIDVEYATKKGIAVTNTPQSVLEPTAEFAFGLLLDAGRRISYYDRKIRIPHAVNWEVNSDVGQPFFGQTLGIIGMGRIGQAVARRAVASGLHILYHNRSRLDEAIEKLYRASYVSLDELLRKSDYISLNAPSTPETYHLIGAAEFEKMKPTAVFVNTARGNLVDEKALAEALREKRIFAAGLDVYENEPKVYPGFLELDNVVLTPHAGTKTKEARIEMARECIRNIIGFYEKTYPVSKVN